MRDRGEMPRHPVGSAASSIIDPGCGGILPSAEIYRVILFTDKIGDFY